MHNTTFSILHKTVKSLFTLILLPCNIQTDIIYYPFLYLELTVFSLFNIFLKPLPTQYISFLQIKGVNAYPFFSGLVWFDYKIDGKKMRNYYASKKDSNFFCISFNKKTSLLLCSIKISISWLLLYSFVIIKLTPDLVDIKGLCNLFSNSYEIRKRERNIERVWAICLRRLLSYIYI